MLQFLRYDQKTYCRTKGLLGCRPIFLFFRFLFFFHQNYPIDFSDFHMKCANIDEKYDYQIRVQKCKPFTEILTQNGRFLHISHFFHIVFFFSYINYTFFCCMPRSIFMHIMVLIPNLKSDVKSSNYLQVNSQKNFFFKKLKTSIKLYLLL